MQIGRPVDINTLLATVICGTLLLLAGCSRSVTGEVSFNRQVLPLMLEKCMPCHAPGGRGHKRSGLLLDSYANLMKGAENGPVITPGRTSKSPLSVYIHPSPDATMQMPLGGKKKLTKTEVDTVDAWITQGARYN